MAAEQATEHRSRLFGLLSVENAIQLVVMLVAIVLTYGALASDVRMNARDNQQNREEISQLRMEREEDRRVMQTIAQNVAVLVERTEKTQSK